MSRKAKSGWSERKQKQESGELWVNRQALEMLWALETVTHNWVAGYTGIFSLLYKSILLHYVHITALFLKRKNNRENHNKSQDREEINGIPQVGLVNFSIPPSILPAPRLAELHTTTMAVHQNTTGHCFQKILAAAWMFLTRRHWDKNEKLLPWPPI